MKPKQEVQEKYTKPNELSSVIWFLGGKRRGRRLTDFCPGEFQEVAIPSTLGHPVEDRELITHPRRPFHPLAAQTTRKLLFTPLLCQHQ
jgi:hypothetical protein